MEFLRSGFRSMLLPPQPVPGKALFQVLPNEFRPAQPSRFAFKMVA